MVSDNLLKQDVKDTIDEVLAKRDEFCSCDQCKNDIFALSLSKLKPRYAGSKEGRVVLNSTDISSTQTRLDILQVVIEAAKEVNQNPHHDRD